MLHVCPGPDFTSRCSALQPLHEKCPNTEFFSGPYFLIFGLNTGKYGPGKTPYLDTFHAVIKSPISLILK